MRLIQVLLLTALFCPSLSIADDKPPPTTLTASILNNFEWRNIGPSSMGGRVSDIAVDPQHPYVIYVGLSTGGVIKSTNNGTNWSPLFDDQPALSIGAVAVAPSNPDIVWVGTGEPNGRNSSGWGDGVYKSTDGGKSWNMMGLADARHCARILIDPKNPDIVWVAAVGHLWDTNETRGVFKTADGGKTWKHVLKIDDKTGCIDLAMGTDGMMYAAMYQRLRTPWSFSGTGDTAGLYRSKDAGETWERLKKGLPEPPLGRIGVSVSLSNPKVVMAVIESQRGGGGSINTERSKEGGIFRSEDGGDHWERMSQNVPRGFYFGQLRVDPKDDKKVYLLGTNLTMSTDAGKTFKAFGRGIHPDFHALWIDPANTDRAICGCDGGIFATYDAGKTWDAISNFPMSQFYEIAADNRDPFHVYGGLQDNDCWEAPSATKTSTGVSNADWMDLQAGGDGFYAAPDIRNPNIIYFESQGGSITRMDRTTGRRKGIRLFAPEGSQSIRFNWNTPFMLSRHNPDNLLVGGNKLFKVWQEGDSFEPISPDLTKNNPARINTEGSGAETYGTIVTIDESPMKEGVIWCGTDDGNVQVTQDYGKTWENVGVHLPKEIQEFYVQRVAASKYDLGTAYLAVGGHRNGVTKPFLFKTTDFGKTWKPIMGDLPDNGPIQTVREGCVAPGVLFVGTTFGCFVSNNDGGHWEKLMKGLPTVEVDDLFVHPRDHAIAAATHGRGVYILDNVCALEELTPEVMAKDVHLCAIPATSVYPIIPGPQLSSREYVARNPYRGAVIYYWLKATTKETPRISIQDSGGKEVFGDNGEKEAGLQRVRWDLRRPDESGTGGGGRRFNPDFTPSVSVDPGVYTVTLRIGSQSWTQELTVREPVEDAKPAEKPKEGPGG